MVSAAVTISWDEWRERIENGTLVELDFRELHYGPEAAVVFGANDAEVEPGTVPVERETA
jgi:hypothetical protein